MPFKRVSVKAETGDDVFPVWADFVGDLVARLQLLIFSSCYKCIYLGSLITYAHPYVCGYLPPLTAFPRGFFAEACPRLACNGRRGGFARSAPQRLREALMSRSTRSPKNPAL